MAFSGGGPERGCAGESVSWITGSSGLEELGTCFFLVFNEKLGSIKIYLLVGGFEHLDCFSIYWECHHPN